MILANDHSPVFLRALEPEDVEILYAWENDMSLWEVSDTLLPFSRHALKRYVEEAHRDIYEVKQLRMVVCKSADHTPVGLADLYDLDPFHRRAGLGILIHDKDERRHGYASESLRQMLDYCLFILGLHQVFACIPVSNTASVQLFEALSFSPAGRYKEWLRRGDGWEDMLLYQKILERQPISQTSH